MGGIPTIKMGGLLLAYPHDSNNDHLTIMNGIKSNGSSHELIPCVPTPDFLKGGTPSEVICRSSPFGLNHILD